MQPTDPLYPQQWHFTRLGSISKIWGEFSGAGIHASMTMESTSHTLTSPRATMPAARLSSMA
jgi:hypothetical protein